MALSGSLTTEEKYGRSVILSWVATQDIASNSSTIKWKLSGSGSAGGWVTVGELRVTINGSQQYYRDMYNTTDAYNGTEFANGSCKIIHNTDGTKSFDIKIEAGIYEWAINTNKTGNFTLNAISRASTISYGTGSSNTAGVSNGVIINIAKINNSYTHTLKYYFGTANGVISNKTTSTTLKWTIPLDLLYKIPNSTSGDGKIICETFNGSTRLGATSLKLTVKAPNNIIPTVTKPKITIDNSSNATVREWGLFVAGYSKANIYVAGNGVYGSSIKSYEISGGYNATIAGSSISYTGDVLSSGNKTFTAVAIDSRGRSSNSATSDTITVYSYSKPNLSLFTVSRNSDNEAKMTVKTNWTYSSVSGKNVLTPTLYYKKQYETSWKTYGTVTNGTTLLSTIFSEFDSYNFRLIIKDSIGNSVSKETFVPTISVTLDLKAGGKGVGIGKPSEVNGLEIDMKTYHLEDIYNGTNAKVRIPVMQKGNINITTVENKPTKGYVKFPVPFAGIPTVVVSPVSEIVGTQVLGTGVKDVTKEGFYAVVTRTNAVSTGVQWIAMY